MTAMLPPLFIFVFTLTIYVLTLSRSVYFGDSGEFIAVAKTLGIAHPPGYPLYTMLAHLFTYLPFGNLPFKVNLFSAVTSSLTVVVIYFVCLKLTKNRLVSASASLFLAFSYLLWLYSLVAEVFALNNLFVALIILISLHIFEKPHQKKLFYLLAFVFGLALTNHHTIVFLAPALLFLILATHPKFFLQPKLLIISSLCFFLGLLPYLYLPIRASQDPILNWGDPDTLTEFLNHILRRDYGTFILSPQTVGAGFNFEGLYFYLSSFVKQFSLAGAIFGILGFFAVFKNKNISFFLILAFIFLGPVFVFATQSQANSLGEKAMLERFFLASAIIFAIWIGYGLMAITKRTTKFLIILPNLLVFLFLLPLFLNFFQVNQSKNFIYEQYGKKIFETLPPNSFIISASDYTIMISTYLQIAQGERPDLKIINFTLLPADWYQENLKQRYNNLTFPLQKFTKELSLTEAEKLICQEVVPNYPTFNFSGKWQQDFNRKEKQSCPVSPFGLLAKLESESKKITQENIEKQLSFWHEIKDQLKNKKPSDLRTQAVLYAYSDALTFFGVTLDEAGLGKEAKSIWEEAFEISSHNEVASQFIAQKYTEEKNFDKAIEWWERAIKAYPKLKFAYRNLAYLYLEQRHDKKRAVYYLRKYLQNTKESSEKEEAKNLINQLVKEL